MDPLTYLPALFLLSLALAYALHAALRRARRPSAVPGSTLRLRCASGVHRSRLERIIGKGWVLSAPLQRDSYVPIRQHETLVVEGAGPSGAYLFRTRVLERDAASHSLVIEAPQRLRPIERRDGKRVPCPTSARLEGEEARIVDLSEIGARIATRVRVGRGERVRLDLEGRSGPLFGWVLGTVQGSDLGYNSAEVRIRFEEAVRI